MGMRKLGEYRSRISRMRLRLATAALASIFVFIVFATSPVLAQTFSVVYRFQAGSGGWNPGGGVILDASGNLYGTASRGGKQCGVVFEVTAAGAETPIHTFGQKGCEPLAGLVQDVAGNFYGTTRIGGRYAKGIVFKLAPDGKFTVLHKFGVNGDDGALPVTGLILGSDGKLYGTTAYGGDANCPSGFGGCGTIFKLSLSGKETILHRFSGGAHDGANPSTGLVQDIAGNLYGATECQSGGPHCHTGVFKLDPSHKLTTLDDRDEARGFVLDAAGNLYGTGSGGSGNCGVNGCGVVFKLDTNSGEETVLYNFLGAPDGWIPLGGVIRDLAGNLYGTTVLGGAFNGGIVFRIDPSGSESILHSFKGSDGAGPVSALVQDGAGNLYGTTPDGGRGCDQSGCGVVFKITP
jgi:uncharacterized repeat protein (TIGR03803 family)